MLSSTVITVRPAQEGLVAVNLGPAVHAFFLDQVRVADPALAEELHSAKRVKSFTVSSLRGVGSVRGERVPVDTDRSYWIRVTTLDPLLSTIWKDRILPSLRGKLRMDTLDFAIEGWTDQASGHPWADTATVEDLSSRHLLHGSAPEPKIRLHFQSPTTFRSGSINIPLPLPGLVFGSLAKRWNELSPLQLPPDVRRFAESCVAVSNLNVRSKALLFSSHWQVGFVGVCTFSIVSRDKYWMRVLNLLADFAFYAGVGHKTTQGMGQTRWIGSKA